MLNLLFITDSPKVENIKTVLQPKLKVIIDVVSDFDQGLKNVFEKRPATVCIQDQISGVTGESVARHIQMLLGNSAPTFILLNSGSGNAKVVKGLYEHLVDLSQSSETVAEEIINILKLLLGVQWAKVFIPPKQTASSIKSAVAVPEGSREDADKLVDDLLSDLENPALTHLANNSATSNDDTATNGSSGDVQSAKLSEPEEVLGTVITEKVQSTSDEMADLLMEQAKRSGSAEHHTNTAVESKVEPGVTSVPKSPLKKLPASQASDSLPLPTPAAVAKSEPAVPPAAGFVISQKTSPQAEPIPDDLLLAFEDNYRAESGFFNKTVIITLIIVVCAGGGWYFVNQDSELVSSVKKRVFSGSPKSKIPPTVAVVVPAKKSLPNPVAPAIVVPTLPKFIPVDGHDGTYAVKNPGWERYVGKSAEFRVFTVAGRIKAIQVLAVNNAPVSDAFLKSVLLDFTGSSEYKISAKKIKSGLHVDIGMIQNKDDIMIYRKNGALKAFVVSIN